MVLILTEANCQMKIKKKYLIGTSPLESLKKRLLNFLIKDLKLILLIWFTYLKLVEISQKKFRNYQMPLKLFEDLRYGDTTPPPPKQIR